MKNATEKFACSEAAAKWIYGKNVTNYILFKNAINAEVFRYDYRNCHKNRTEAGICDDNQFVIGTCGRLSPEKNQIFLVEIFAEIKKVMDDSKLILIGDGSEKENILNQAIKLDVDKDIIWTGMVSNASYYYSMLDCFVLPSIFEGLPLAGVEAQAAGILCFFSTGITSEIKITDKTYFLELERGPEYWAKEILLKRCSKEDTYDLVLDAGYDIGENVGFLQKTYMKYSVEI